MILSGAEKGMADLAETTAEDKVGCSPTSGQFPVVLFIQKDT
jgi:hypothetical protein